MKFDRNLQVRLPAILDDALRIAASRMGLDRGEYVRFLIALALQPKLAKGLVKFVKRVEELVS
jgi:hypothetical protein